MDDLEEWRVLRLELELGKIVGVGLEAKVLMDSGITALHSAVYGGDGGSSPSCPAFSSKLGSSSPDRAPVSDTGGSRFKSYLPSQVCAVVV